MTHIVILLTTMNNKSSELLNSFFDSVASYIDLEYDLLPIQKRHLNHMYSIISSYYFGGNTVCETAGYVVTHIRNIKYEQQ